jgi:hypothetical protein
MDLFKDNFVKFFLFLWLLAIGFGMFVLLKHANSPSKLSHSPELWPKTSKLSLAKDKPTLVLFSHPKCPCTRATIGELASLMAHCQNRLQTYVLFTRPKNFPEKWEQTDIWESAKLIPGVSVISDPEGQEASLFQAITSGQVVVYNPNGNLVFSGGITSARGHFGDNIGRQTVIAIANKGSVPQPTTPVFGCSLCLPSNNKNLSSKETNK